MTMLDSPKTPKADYAVMEHGAQSRSTKNLSAQRSLPILATGGKQQSQDMWEPASARSGDYVNDLQSTQPKDSCLPSPLRKLARSWMVLRWQLARNLLAVPMPFLTSMLDVKLGDLFVTLPLCVFFVITTATQAINDREIESTGNPPTYGLLVVFVLAVRNNSVLLALTGISFERALFYHKVAALITIILSGLHGLAYLLARNKGEVSGKEDMVLTGTVAFGAMVFMFVLSLGFVRRRFFELFLRTHWILLIVVLVFAVMHGASTALIGVIPWGVDMAFRHAYRPRVYARGSIIGGKKPTSEDVPAISSKRMGVIAREQLTVKTLPDNVVQIQFPRVRRDTGEAFNYESGQYVFLCVPAISSLQWHPFTISSSPHEPMVSFHIKALGDWTLKLQSMVSAASAGAEVAAPFDVLVDGPYGGVSIDIKNSSTYSHFVLFSGGIGVTPMRSIVNWLYYEAHNEGRLSLERVHFVWTLPDRELAQSLVVDEAHNAGEYKGESYFPHGIVNNHGGAFTSEIFLTRSERDLESAELDRHLGDTLQYGSRPDITETLRTIGEQAKQSGKKRVAVLVCGPSGMVRDVINKSLALSWEMKIRFDVHSEVFEF
jgi:predicted ferric reductase